MSKAPKNTPFVWTDETREILETSYFRGDTMQSIATRLSALYTPITKSAICGMAFRLKLKRHADFVPNAHGAGSKARKVKPEKRVKLKPRITEQEAARLRRAKDLQKAEAKRATGEVMPRPVVQDSDLLAVEPKGIMALGNSCCRWPLNRTADDGSTLFCCNDRGSDRPYCPGHALLAWQKTRTPEQIEADKALRLVNVNRAGVNPKAARHFNTPFQMVAA